MKRLAALTLFLFSNFSSAIEPSWTYRVLVSPHFEVIYRDTQKALAKRYLLAAEQAHELLLPIFKEGPSRTLVVLQDDTDLANGLANFLPYPHIVVYPVLPEPGETIDEYGDWALEMMVHEYAHILNMYPAHGVYMPFKYILGTVVRPNAVLPRWYLEGLAVNLETRLTDFGRLRSVESAASARALFLGDKFKDEDIATINESDMKTFPFGGRPYLYGGWWWDEVHRQKGEEVIYKLNQNYSRRLPFFVNGPIYEQTGLSAADALKAAFNSQRERAEREVTALKRAGETPSNDLLPGTENALTFRLSPSGLKLVYWQGLFQKGAFAFLRTRENPEQEFKDREQIQLFPASGTSRVEWLNDNEIVFDQIDIYRPRVNYRDLYKYNLNDKKTERLTVGARAQDAAVSPSGRRIAFIQNDGGRTKLASLDLNDLKVKGLVGGNLKVRLSSPAFLDEDRLLFVVRTRDGAEKIHLYDFKSKKSQVYFDGLKNIQIVRQTQFGLLFTDATTGARNVYRLEGKKASPLTNTLTTIHGFDYDSGRKSLQLIELTGEGPRFKEMLPKKVSLPTLEKAEFEPPLSPNTQKISFRDESFWPISYMAPRYIIPTIYSVEDGYILQGLTSGQDPIGRNVYTLSGQFDSITNKASYGASYLNSSYRASLGLDYAHSVSYLGASGRLIESSDAQVNFAGPLTSRYTSWGLGGLWSDTDGLRSSYKRVGPRVALAYKGLNKPGRSGFGMNLEASHTEFLDQDGYTTYGRSFAHLTMVEDFGNHKLAFQVRAALSPGMAIGSSIDIGDRTVGGNYLVSLTNSEFLMRGYPSGTFVSRKMINGNLEWAFPVSQIGRGFGLFPLFLRQVEISLFGDAVAVDGGAYSSLARGYVRSYLDEFYVGTGAEARLTTTMAYHVPVAVILGLYYGFKDEYGGGLSPFLGLGLGSLGPISKKTP